MILATMTSSESPWPTGDPDPTLTLLRWYWGGRRSRAPWWPGVVHCAAPFATRLIRINQDVVVYNTLPARKPDRTRRAESKGL
jgi:hypothetical protein